MTRQAFEVPYQLTFDTRTGRICARGKPDLLVQLREIPDAQVHNYTGHPVYISIPSTRLNYMIVESLESVESVTDGYRDARARAMALSPEALAAVSRRLEGINLSPEMYLDFQLEFFSKALPLRGVFNGCEQGLGKTLMNLTLALMWGSQRILVVCPKSVATEWGMQYEKWFRHSRIPSHLKLWLFTEESIGVRDKAFHILRHEEGRQAACNNFETIRNLEEAIKYYEPDLVIIDESQWVKNRTAKVTMAMERICRLPSVQHVIDATGTPIGNAPGDLWSQLRMLGEGIVHDNYYAFENRFTVWEQVYDTGGIPLVRGGRTVRKAVGCQDPAGLMRLIEPVWFRATKASSLNLPPKETVRVTLDMLPEAREIYRRVAEDGEQALGKGLSLAGEMVIALRLQQICGGMAPLFELNEDGLTYTQSQVELPDVKLQWVLQWLRDHLDGTTRVILWHRFNSEITRYHRAIAAQIGEEYIAVCNGATKDDKLVEYKNSFNSRSRDGIQVLVCQIDKMHAGHNLQAGDFNIYVSHTWSYLKRAQSEDRTHRLGRENSVTNIDLVLRNTVDEELMLALSMKKDLAIRLAPHTVSGVQSSDTGISEEQLQEVGEYLE